jgi:hypothetical protein
MIHLALSDVQLWLKTRQFKELLSDFFKLKSFFLSFRTMIKKERPRICTIPTKKMKSQKNEELL